MYEAPDRDLSSWNQVVDLILINTLYKREFDQELFLHVHKMLALKNFLTIRTPEE